MARDCAMVAEGPVRQEMAAIQRPNVDPPVPERHACAAQFVPHSGELRSPLEFGHFCGAGSQPAAASQAARRA